MRRRTGVVWEVLSGVGSGGWLVVHAFQVTLKVIAAVELVATPRAAEGAHAAVDVEVPLQVVFVVLAAEMHSTHGAVIPLRGPVAGRHLGLQCAGQQHGWVMVVVIRVGL